MSFVVQVLVTRETTGSGAFDALFVAHVAGLVRSITVVCGDRETAADCVQEAFLRAHERWDRVGTYEDPVGWVRHVALNLARDVHRRRVRSLSALLRLRSAAAAGGHGADVVPEQPDGDGALAAALASLPPRQRAAMALRYVEALSVAEIARALGISEGAVKFHLHAGRQRLRPLLRAGE